MAQCSKCMKKGLFLKVNSEGLCEACAKEKQDKELVIRKNANITAQETLAVVTSMQNTAETILSLQESGAVSKAVARYAMNLLNAAVDAAKTSIAAVRTGSVETVQDIADAAKSQVGALKEDLLKLLSPLESDRIYARHYSVVGVTFKNDDGMSRQTFLQLIAMGAEPFEKVNAGIKQYTYQGSPAIGVYANDVQIGNISKDDVSEILDNGDTQLAFDLEVYGGKNGKSYGAEIILTYRK